jgi:hypothetical protein
VVVFLHRQNDFARVVDINELRIAVIACNISNSGRVDHLLVRTGSHASYAAILAT